MWLPRVLSRVLPPHNRLLAGALCAPLSIAALAGSQEEYDLSGYPAADTALARELTSSHLLVLDSLSRQVGDGAPQRLDQRAKIETENRLVVIDQFGPGRTPGVPDFRRSVIESKVDAAQDHQVEGASLNRVSLKGVMEGLSVVFTWVPEEQAYARHYDAKALRESLLKNLSADMDLRGILPPGPVPVGAQWSVPPDAVRAALAPGGDPRYQTRKGAERVLTRTLQLGVGGSLHNALEGHSAGDIKATFVEMVADPEGGKGLAVIEFNLDGLRYLRDITNFSEDNRLRRESDAGVDKTSGQMVTEISGKGTMIWDLDRRCLRYYSFSGKEIFRTDVRVEGEKGKYAEQLQLSGKVNLVLVVRPAEPPAPAPTAKR